MCDIIIIIIITKYKNKYPLSYIVSATKRWNRFTSNSVSEFSETRCK